MSHTRKSPTNVFMENRFMDMDVALRQTSRVKSNGGNGHEKQVEEKSKVQDFGLVKNTAGQCPECSNLLVYQEGCFVCPGCGYTKC